MATITERKGWLGSFLNEALASLSTRRLLVPALVLTVLLTVSNIVILFNVPEKGQMPPWPFLAAALVRVGGLLLVTVTVLRLLAGSARPSWRPDGAFWLYSGTLLFVIAVSAAVEAAIGGGRGLGPSVLRGTLVTLVSAPLAVWFTAIAVERPLAWRPSRYMRDLGRWLPPLLFWALLLTTPLGVVHARLDEWLLKGAGEWFWPVVLIDGPLSAATALISLVLAASAYRRVAQG
jgi:hypothetical protein